MMIQLSARNILSWTFILLSVASILNISLATVNYLGFYTALSQLQFRATTITFEQRSTSQPSILARVVLDNPANYAGLTVDYVSLLTYFTYSNSSLLRDHPLTDYLTLDEAIGAHTEAAWDMKIPLVSQAASSLSSIYQENSGNVTAHVI